jgi:hypothetical protein
LDATATLRALAAAELTKDNAIYQVHLNTAGALAAELAHLKWDVLDDLAARADETGQHEATAIIDRLRDAARRDEHAIALAPRLREADRAALDLVIRWTRKQEPTRTQPDPGTAPRPDQVGQTPERDVRSDATKHPRHAHRVRGRDIADVVAKIRAEANASPDAEFEITWQVVES